MPTQLRSEPQPVAKLSAAAAQHIWTGYGSGQSSGNQKWKLRNSNEAQPSHDKPEVLLGRAAKMWVANEL